MIIYKKDTEAIICRSRKSKSSSIANQQWVCLSRWEILTCIWHDDLQDKLFVRILDLGNPWAEHFSWISVLRRIN